MGEPCIDELADIYVTAQVEQRVRIAAAVDGLNTRLRADPLAVGESRSGGTRIVFVALLAVAFHVSDSARTVRVARVTRYGR